LYFWTVAKHLNAKGLGVVQQWFNERSGKVIGTGTAVQSATGQMATLNCASWPGATCAAVLELHEGLLDQAWKFLGMTGCDAHVKCAAAWAAFMKWNYEVGDGCDDDQPAKDAHADRLAELGEEVRKRFLDEVVPANRFTPYMHSIAHHLAPLAREYGSLVRLSSQGLEALHQWVKFTTTNRSNRKACDVPQTVVTRVTVGSAVLSKCPSLRQKAGGKRKRVSITGGHRSKADTERRAETRTAFQDEHP
jgi:hypothetical protein